MPKLAVENFPIIFLFQSVLKHRMSSISKISRNFIQTKPFNICCSLKRDARAIARFRLLNTALSVYIHTYIIHNYIPKNYLLHGV